MQPNLIVIDQSTWNELTGMIKNLSSEIQGLKSRKDQHGVDLDKYISLTKVTDLLGVDRDTMYRYKIHIDHVKRFNQIYFLKDSLETFMQSGKINPQIKAIRTTQNKKIKPKP